MCIRDSVADAFRYRMIEYMGRKNYYLKRRGDMNLSPVEQRPVSYTHLDVYKRQA